MKEQTEEKTSTFTVNQKTKKSKKGFLNPQAVKSFTFYTIVFCILASVVACILAIWDFAQQDVFWRMIATFLVVASGAGAFAFVNGIFGEEDHQKS